MERKILNIARFQRCTRAPMMRILGFSLLVSTTGCSLGSFFGSGRDENVLNTTSYRKVNLDCSFKAEKLDEDNLVSLVRCFNSHGALPKVVKAVEAAGKDRLGPVVRVLNNHFINNKQRLYEIEVSHQTLKDKGIADEVLRQLGRILKNGEFVSNLIAMMKDGFNVDATTIYSNATPGKKIPDPYILKSFALLSEGLTNTNLNKTLNFGLNLSGSRSFQEVHKNFKEGLTSVRSLSNLTDGLFYFNKEKHTYFCDANHPKEDLSKEVFQAIKTKDLFKVLEELFAINPAGNLIGTPADPLKERIALLAVTIQALTQDPGNQQDELIKKLGVAFNELIPQSISCLKQGVEISNPALLIVKELVEKKQSYDLSRQNSSTLLAQDILQTYPLHFMALEPFCTMPSQLKTHFPVLQELARTGYQGGILSSTKTLIDPLTEVLKTAYVNSVQPWKGCGEHSTSITGSEAQEYRLVANLMLHLMADVDPTLNAKSTANAPKKGIDHLLPILREFSKRNVWTDLLLVLTVPGYQNREDLKDLSVYLVSSRAELNGKSIADVMLEAIGRHTSPLRLYKLVSSLEYYIDLEDDFLEKFLIYIRQAVLANNVNPIFDIVKEVLKEAPENPDFYNAIFSMSEQDEFADAIAEIADMAMDGRLKQLLDASIKVFHRFAEEGRNPNIKEFDVPPFLASRRHNFTRSDLTSYVLKGLLDTKSLSVMDECKELDFDVSIFESANSKQLEYFLKCLNSDGKHSDLVDAVQILKESGTKDGGPSLFDRQVNLVKTFGNNLSSADFSYVIESWKSYYNEYSSQSRKYFHNLLDLFPLLVKGIPAQGITNEKSAGPILKPLASVAGSVLKNAESDFNELQNYTSKLITHKDFPGLLSDLHEIIEDTKSNASVGSHVDQPDVHLETEKRLNPSGDFFVAEVLKNLRPWYGPVDRQFDDKFILRIKTWVQNKECDGLSQHDDDPELLKRVVRILNEPRENLNNWELVSNFVGGPNDAERPNQPRKKWEFYEFRRWVEPIIKKLADPKLSMDQKWVLDAHIDFLKYFSAPVDGMAVPDGKVHTQFTPEWLAKWFHDRAIDYRPITYFYPGEIKPRVRIVNTLDMFELVTLNADFLAPKPIAKNLGLRNLALLGDAWGDIADPKLWPPEIQAKYPDPKNRPLTILQAVREISRPSAKPWDPGSWVGTENLHTLAFYIVGLPKLPTCHKNIPGEKVDPQAKGMAGWFLGHELQSRLYNIFQVIDVMEENSPNGTIEGSYKTGLEFFRNLFFELNYSSPENARKYVEDVDLTKDGNHLTIVSYSNKIGGLRLIGSLVQNLRGDDPALKDLFYAFIHTAKSPGFRELLKTTYESPEGRNMFWNLLREILDIVNKRGEPGGEEKIARMKETVFYLLANLNHLEPWMPPSSEVSHSVSSSSDLVSLILKRVNEISSKEQYRNFLTKDKNGLVQDILTSEMSSKFVRNLYQTSDISRFDSKGPNFEALKAANQERIDRLQWFLRDFLSDEAANGTSRVQSGSEVLRVIYGDKTTRETWRTFIDRATALYDSDQYKKLEIKESILPVLRFFEHKTRDGYPSSPYEKELSNRLRQNVADLIQTRDLNAFLALEREKPEKFDQLMETFSRYIGQNDQGELKEFLKVLHQRLSAPKH